MSQRPLTAPIRLINFSPFVRGHLPAENIVPYVGNKMKYGNSGVRIKGFYEGMWEIQNTPGVGSKLKVSARRSEKVTRQEYKNCGLISFEYSPICFVLLHLLC